MNQFKDSPETTILAVRGLNKSATSFDVDLHEMLDPGTVYLFGFTGRAVRTRTLPGGLFVAIVLTE